MRALGVVACAGYAAHAVYYWRSGDLEQMLWVCPVSAFVVGVGLLSRSPLANAVGTFGLAVGFPTWLLYLFAGGDFIPTSVLTHVVGFAIGLVGVLVLGVPRTTWWVAVLYIALMMTVARAVTMPESNINLAFGPDPDLSLWTVDGPVHWALQLGQWALAFGALQFVSRRLLSRRTESVGNPDGQAGAA